MLVRRSFVWVIEWLVIIVIWVNFQVRTRHRRELAVMVEFGIGVRFQNSKFTVITVTFVKTCF